MKALRLAAAIMLLASPAVAQIPKLNLLQDNKPAMTPDEKAAEDAQQKAYKDSLKKIPDAEGALRSLGHCAKHGYGGFTGQVGLTFQAESQEPGQRRQRRFRQLVPSPWKLT